MKILMFLRHLRRDSRILKMGLFTNKALYRYGNLREINFTDAHNVINFSENRARIESYLATLSRNNLLATFFIRNLWAKIFQRKIKDIFVKIERWNLLKTVKTLVSASHAAKTTYVLMYSFRCLLSPPREENILCLWEYFADPGDISHLEGNKCTGSVMRSSKIWT